MLFPGSSVATLRREEKENLPHTAAISSRVSSYGPGGVVTDTYVLRDTLPCRYGPLGNTPQERVIADQSAARNPGTVTFEVGTGIFLTDRMVVTGESAQDVPWSLAVEVVGIAGPRAAEIRKKVIVADLPPSVA